MERGVECPENEIESNNEEYIQRIGRLDKDVLKKLRLSYNSSTNTASDSAINFVHSVYPQEISIDKIVSCHAKDEVIGKKDNSNNDSQIDMKSGEKLTRHKYFNRIMKAFDQRNRKHKIYRAWFIWKECLWKSLLQTLHVSLIGQQIEHKKHLHEMRFIYIDQTKFAKKLSGIMTEHERTNSAAKEKSFVLKNQMIKLEEENKNLRAEILRLKNQTRRVENQKKGLSFFHGFHPKVMEKNNNTPPHMHTRRFSWTRTGSTSSNMESKQMIKHRRSTSITLGDNVAQQLHEHNINSTSLEDIIESIIKK